MTHRSGQDVSKRVTPGVENEGVVCVEKKDQGGDRAENKDHGGGQQKGRYNLRPRKNNGSKNANGRSRQEKRKAKNSSQVSNIVTPYSAPVVDIDKDVASDPQFATAYVQDIYAHYRSMEASTSIRPLYMKDQEHINEQMRAVLVDWMIEAHLKFKFVPETLYLTVNIIDRYLSKEQVTRPKLQLVGVAALLIATKYEEIYQLPLSDCTHICDNAYDKEQILSMEEDILKTLDYRVTIPSAHAFLLRYLKAADINPSKVPTGSLAKKVIQISCFLLDSSLSSYYLLSFLPSQLAAAAIFVARKTVGKNAWSRTLQHYTQYREEEVLPVARAIVAVKTYCSSGLRAVNKKYSSSRYGGVAKIELCTDF